MESVPLLQDIPLRSTFFALTIRSPVPRGRLLSVECPPLERAYTLIRAADIPGARELADFSVPILAGEEISYLGEPVALLVGPNQIKLLSYALNCKVLVQEEAARFAVPASESASPVEEGPGGECFAEREYRRGDPEAAFAGAARILEGRYSTGIQEHGYGESVGALVEYNRSSDAGEQEAEAPLIVHTATQWPRHVSRSVAAVLGLREGGVITEPSGADIAMDGKLWYPSLIACQAALAAFLTRRNVRLLLNRDEDFRYSPKRNASVTEIRSALDEKGEILGTRIDMTLDLGARPVFEREILDQSCLAVMGIAGRGALDLRARAIRTNIPPQGPLGGFGAAQGAYAMGRQLSRIADSLGLDPIEWWKQNRPGGEGPAESPHEGAPIDQLLDTAASMGDYYRKWASYELLRRKRREGPPRRPETLRGIGVALGWQGSGFLYPPPAADREVELTLNIDGSLEIRGNMGAGGDLAPLWSAIAREILAVEEVRVSSLDRAGGPDSGPGTLSRNISGLVPLVRKCCETIRNLRFRDPLPITVHESSGEDPGPLLPQDFGSPARDEPARKNSKRPGWGAAVVEIELEAHSSTPSIRGIWMAVDGGRILSEERARRSLRLAAIQALGWASREYLEYREGALWPGGITSYGLPNPGEIPGIHIDFLWDSATESRGIGDLPFSSVPAAYIQAVSQALDWEYEKIPLKPSDIWEIRQRKIQGQDDVGPTQEAEK